MTLSVKLLLIAALVLGIIIPFGYFLLGEHTKRRYKSCLLYTSDAADEL